MVGAWGEAELIETAFDLHEYDPTAELTLGPLRAQLREVPHFTRTFAASFDSEAGARFVFGADCGPNEEIVALASGSDLLMLEATLPEPDTSERPGHLSAAQAGELGRRAGVSRLVLTHYTDELDGEELATVASRAFGRRVSMATEGAVYRL
jgi:ribonuclease BN (tRNA processing enzyme)